MTVRPTDRPSAPQAYQCKLIQATGMATQMQLEKTKTESGNLEYREKIKWAEGQREKERQRARAEDKELFVGRTT